MATNIQFLDYLLGSDLFLVVKLCADLDYK